MQTTLKTDSAPSTVAAFGLVGPLTGESIGGNRVQSVRKAPCIHLLCRYPCRTAARAKAVSSQDTLRAAGTQPGTQRLPTRYLRPAPDVNPHPATTNPCPRAAAGPSRPSRPPKGQPPVTEYWRLVLKLSRRRSHGARRFPVFAPCLALFDPPAANCL